MKIKVNKKKVVVALGQMLILKEEMGVSTEFDVSGAGENYKQGFIEGIEACIKFMREAVVRG